MVNTAPHQLSPRQCLTCHYDLTGLAASDVRVKCPECGFWCEAGEGLRERSFGVALLRIISPQIAASIIVCASALLKVFLPLLLLLPVIAFAASVLIYAVEVKPPGKRPLRRNYIALALLALVDSAITVALALLLLWFTVDFGAD